jgi:hypothetical protein
VLANGFTALFLDIVHLSDHALSEKTPGRENMSFLVEGLSPARETVSQVRHIGEFQLLRDALVAAERAIREYLFREFRPGMLPSALFSQYKSHGEVPYIFSDNGETTMSLPGFNYLNYALSQCAEICTEQRFGLR